MSHFLPLFPVLSIFWAVVFVKLVSSCAGPDPPPHSGQGKGGLHCSSECDIFCLVGRTQLFLFPAPHRHDQFAAETEWLPFRWDEIVRELFLNNRSPSAQQAPWRRAALGALQFRVGVSPLDPLQSSQCGRTPDAVNWGTGTRFVRRQGCRADVLYKTSL